MSAVSDPDRLERLAVYVCDYPPNATQEELSEALGDAAQRIRRLQVPVAQIDEAIANVSASRRAAGNRHAKAEYDYLCGRLAGLEWCRSLFGATS